MHPSCPVPSSTTVSKNEASPVPEWTEWPGYSITGVFLILWWHIPRWKCQDSHGSNCETFKSPQSPDLNRLWEPLGCAGEGLGPTLLSSIQDLGEQGLNVVTLQKVVEANACRNQGKRCSNEIFQRGSFWPGSVYRQWSQVLQDIKCLSPTGNIVRYFFFPLPVLFKVKVLQLQAWKKWAVLAELGFVIWLSVSLLFPQQAFSFWAFMLVPDQLML